MGFDEATQVGFWNAIDQALRWRVVDLLGRARGTEHGGDASLLRDTVVVKHAGLVEPAMAARARDPLELRMAGNSHLLEGNFLVVSQEERRLGQPISLAGERSETSTTHHRLERSVDEIAGIRGNHHTTETAVERGRIERLVAAVTHTAYSPASILEELLLQHQVLFLQQRVLLLELLLEGCSIGKRTLDCL